MWRLVAEWPERHAGAVVLILLFLFMFGTVGAARIPVDRFGPAPGAVVEVQAAFPGFDAAAIEQQITEPLERVLAYVPGVKIIESHSRNGGATVALHFAAHTGSSDALADLGRRMAESAADLPAGAEPPSVFVKDASARPAIVYAFTAAEWSDEVARWVKDIFVDPLREVPEVALIAIVGLDQYEIHVEPEPRRLAGLGLGFDDLIAALRGSAAAPRRKSGRNVVMVPGTPEAIAAHAVRLPSGESIALGEVARVSLVPITGVAQPRFDNAPALRVSIYPRTPQEAAHVAERAQAHLAWLRANEVVPPGVGVHVLHDEPAATRTWRAGALQRAAMAIILTLGVVLLALGAHAARLAAAAFGVWLAISVAASWILGFTLNATSAVGLILAFAPFAAMAALRGRTALFVSVAALGGALVASLGLGAGARALFVVLLAFFLGVVIRWLMAPWLSRSLGKVGWSRRSRFGAPPSKVVAAALFVFGIDVAIAATVSQIEASQPEGRFHFQVTGVDRTQLEAIAESLLPSLHAIANVRDVVSTATRAETWRLHLDDARMEAVGLHMAEVGRAFAIATEGLVVGEVVNAERRLPLRLQLRSGVAGDSFERLLLRGERDKRAAVYLRDIGFVERIVEARERLRLNGRTAVEITARWEGEEARARLQRFCERIEVPEGYAPNCIFASPAAP